MGVDPVEDGADGEFDSVDGLLEAYFRDGREPTTPPAADDDFGPFRILATLGQGGMGQVFLAEQQEPVRRHVALKVLRVGLDSQALLRRFAAEQQVLARMNHDCIARLFSAGRSRLGRPFFVMEHVPGEPITEYCDRQRLSVEQRLELFLQVCAGVQHAHDNAVLHRDLKPGNILVADQGGRIAVKVIDFGLARALDTAPGQRASHSRFGAVLGTPDYMSPEQASGAAELTAATDVYSLGVILFELLVGARPLEGLDQDSPLVAQRRIVHEELPLPSARLCALPDRGASAAATRATDARRLLGRLRGNLDSIVSRAMRKEPERRYANARALAEDLANLLVGAPITARPESQLSRARRWLRRHPGIASGAAVAAAAFVLSGSVLWALLVSRSRAELSGRASAVRAEGDPRLLSDLLDPERLTRMPYEAQRSVLEVALQFHRRRIEAGSTADRTEIVDAQVEIGTALRKLGRAVEAQQALSDARSLADQLLAADPASNPVRGCRGRAADGLAHLMRDAGNPDAALTLAEAALSDLRAAASAAETPLRAALAEAMGTMVDALCDLARPREALAIADEQMMLLSQLTAAAPAQPPPLCEVLRAHYSRGLALTGLSRWDEARFEAERAVAIAITRAGQGSLDQDVRFMLLANRRLLARVLHKLAGDRDDGPPGREARAALADVRALVAEYPGSLPLLDQLARCLHVVAEWARREANLSDARVHADEGLQVALRVLDSAPDNRRHVDVAHALLVTASKARAALGDGRGAAAEALALAARVPALKLGAAQVLAQLSGVSPDAAEAATMADQAVALLRQVDTASPRVVHALVWSRDLFPLRPRADFNSLAPPPPGWIDDREATVPVAAIWRVGLRGADVQRLIGNGWRVVDLELETAVPPRFAASLVRNEGSYRREQILVTDVDTAAIGATCAERNLRVVDLVRIEGGANPRFAALLGQRNGSHGWLWLPETDVDGLRGMAQQNHARPWSLAGDPGMAPGAFGAVLIGNHQWDFRDWRVRVATADQVRADLADGWSFTDIVRQPDDLLCCVQTRAPVRGQRLLLAATATQMTDATEDDRCRVVAFCTYQRDGQRRYDAVLNPNR